MARRDASRFMAELRISRGHGKTLPVFGRSAVIAGVWKWQAVLEDLPSQGHREQPVRRFADGFELVSRDLSDFTGD
jgi:hypothetical protein